ncbi:Fanconi-associated nuclease 1 -like protein [Capsicum baccatum]|uniref:Fanconi-associated nuclease n=1 Tax=Capsicum baccatum TaxID=33114 RepID=A0A2G2V6T5_CAPBA|nr:Fanconi-associated nuclease 1 -like protein [Capsicum baccatum]
MNPKEKLSKDDGAEKVDETYFRSFIGCLMYLTATRPDILYVVSILSRFMHCPSEVHVKAAKRIVRYIKGTITYGYSDSEWRGSKDDSKSTSGHCFSLGSGIFSWSCKKQDIVAQSTAEAEFVAATTAKISCSQIRISWKIRVNNFVAQSHKKIVQNADYGTRKQDYIARVLGAYESGLCPNLPSKILGKTGSCIRISASAESVFWRAERLFFLNGEQDLSAFLLVDLGIVKYPSYNCIFTDQIFPDRNSLLSYEEAIEVAQVIDEFLDENNNELVSRCIEISAGHVSSSVEEDNSAHSGPMAAFLSFFSAKWVHSKVILLGVSFLEHERRYKDAIDLLKLLLVKFKSDRRRGYWTLRLSIDLEHVGCIDDSLEVAEKGLLDPWVRSGSIVALQRRVLRLGKPPRRWKTPSFSDSLNRKIVEVHVQGRPVNCKTGVKNVFYGEDGERCGVEDLALEYYAGEGGCWQGVHTESGIWLTIFGILMWDVLFADVPNVFRTKFQIAPLDLETDSFYEARKGLVEALLDKIEHGMAEELLIMSWESHVGTACRGVNWDKHSLSELRAAVTCIGGICLASICRNLAQDYRSWSSGMPDLLLWRFHDDYSGEAKLVEVKGPRDRLSEQQRAWLLFLMDCGFTVEVCKVSIVSFSLVTTLYVSLAFMGAKLFGPQVSSQITLSMPHDKIITKIALWATILTPMTKYALEFAPFAIELEENLPSSMKSKVKMMIRGLVGSILLLVILILALCVPYFEHVLSLTGSLVSVGICLIFPCAFYTKIFWGEISKKGLVLNVVLIIIGVFLGVVGTVSSSKLLVRSLKRAHD